MARRPPPADIDAFLNANARDLVGAARWFCVEQLSETTGIAPAVLLAWFRARGVRTATRGSIGKPCANPRPRKTVPPHLRQYVRDEIRRGTPPLQIAKEVGIGADVVRRWLREEGFRPVGAGQSVRWVKET